MKRLMVVDGKALRLVEDPLNQRILRLLVGSELSVNRLSKMLGEPPLKIWRRVQQLKSGGLVEESGGVRIRNLEVKLFRATAARYIPRGAFDYEPEDDMLRRAYTLFHEIQSKILGMLLDYDIIPPNVNPVDFCVAADLYVYAKLLTREDTQKKLKTILELLENSPYTDVILRRQPSAG